MIQIIDYTIVNGSKSEPHKFNKTVNSKKELETLREVLEVLHCCYRKTVTGATEKLMNIIFTYKEK